MRTGSLVTAIVAALLGAFWLGTRFAEPTPIARAPASPLSMSVAVPGVDALPAPRSPTDTPRPLADILRLPGDFAQTTALYVLASTANEAALVQLLDEATTIEPLGEREAAAAILYQRFAELAPATAMNDVLRRGELATGRSLSAIFQAWSRQDLDAAVARAAALPQPLRDDAALAILSAREDLGDDVRTRLAVELEVTGKFDSMLASELMRRSTDDPSAGWAAVLRLPDSPYRSSRVARATMEWWRRDPDAARVAVEGLEDKLMRRELVKNAGVPMVQTEPEAALEWGLSTSQSADARWEMQMSIVTRWAGADPGGARVWFDAQRDSRLRLRTVGFVASAYASLDWSDALAWTMRLVPQERVRAIPMVAVQMLEEDPERAGDLVLEQADPSGIRYFAMHWLSRDAPATAAWVAAKVEDETARTELLRVVVPMWARADRSAALGFLDGLATGPAYDRVALGTIHALHGEFALTDRVYRRIRDPHIKQEAEAAMRDAARAE